MNVLKLALLLLWAALALAPEVFSRVAGLEGFGPLAGYFVLLAATLFGIIAAAFVRSGALRWVSAVLFAGGALVATGFAKATGQFLTYDAFINMLGSRGFLGEALGQFGTPLAIALVFSLLLLLAIGLPARGKWQLAPIAACLPLAVLAGLTAMLFVRGGEGARGLPSSYTTLAYVGLYTAESAMMPSAERDASKLPLDGEPAGHIVLVIDESVAGHYLDINTSAGVETPLSREWPGLAITNFGVVPSITNCSIGSNLGLRFGGKRENYREILASGASIWAYAKRAGMRTVYIDAQRTGGALHNGMDEEERSQIDLFVQFDDTPILQRDQLAADRIAAELANPQPSFILVNKVGAHFPIHDKYPDSHMRYAPALARGSYTEVADTGDRDGFDGTSESWRLYRNSYRNSISWSVGSFFERLLSNADLSSTILIYTADHGQDLRADGRTGLTTHCTAEPIPAEGAVPLIVIAGETREDARFVAQGNGSQYRIFPTIMTLMGYQQAASRAAYGPDLFDPSREPDTFNARFNARLGQEPVWVSIDAENLANPVRADQGEGSLIEF
ncbi:sulfatase-like hydrolase/transferase [uncultured Erythrobacter sp.]|uniref:sulfatase-like hydrolase/transferase n=1 Tax=uncultured Erythrobacter sp. TaxID=263913 RepID=UPI0026144F7D|nr:sulfatase-like hydrolase/transferase [uncultured Erythrobacter sp.]